METNQITDHELLVIIGSKEVEKYLLQKKISQKDEAIRALSQSLDELKNPPPPEHKT